MRSESEIRELIEEIYSDKEENDNIHTFLGNEHDANTMLVVLKWVLKENRNAR